MRPTEVCSLPPASLIFTVKAFLMNKMLFSLNYFSMKMNLKNDIHKIKLITMKFNVPIIGHFIVLVTTFR